MSGKWDKGCESHPAYKMVYDALVWYKAILPGWRIRIDNIEASGYQFSWIEVSIWEPKKRKPSISWRLYTDTFRKSIDFTQSVFNQLS